MTPNDIYRPGQGELDPSKIPTWDEKFYQNYDDNLHVSLAIDPAPDPQDLSANHDATLINPAEADTVQVEELTPEEVKALWDKSIEKGHNFDGVFQKGGKIYFFRNRIHNDPVRDSVCEGVPLEPNLTPTEAMVLELWTSLSPKNFGPCDTGSKGERPYKALLKEEDYPKIQKELDKFIAALEWQKANPEKTDNPHNLDQLPLNISLEKVKTLRGKFVFKKDVPFHQQSRAEKLEDGWWVGLGFALAAGVIGGIWYGIKWIASLGRGPRDGDGTPGDSDKTSGSTQGGEGGATELEFSALSQDELATLQSLNIEPLEGPAPYRNLTQIGGQWVTLPDELAPLADQPYYATVDDFVQTAQSSGFVVATPAGLVVDTAPFEVTSVVAAEISAGNVYEFGAKYYSGSDVVVVSTSNNAAKAVTPPTLDEAAANLERKLDQEGGRSSIQGAPVRPGGSGAPVRVPVRTRLFPLVP
jgi:hypothetical protein